MSDTPATSPPRKLRANAIGVVAAATLGIVFMSPALAFYGNWGPVAATIGSPTPLVFLLAAHRRREIGDAGRFAQSEPPPIIRI